jgi:hypothetical protein
LRLMVTGVRDGFGAVRSLGHKIAPFGLRALFMWMPAAFAVRYWRRFFAADMADFVFGRHAAAASGEMRELANDCRSMLKETGVSGSALQKLYSAIDDYAGGR